MIRQPMNDNWIFNRLDGVDSEKAFLPDQGEAVHLPHTFAEEGKAWKGIGAYRRSVQTNPEWKTLFIEFEAVDQSCRVFIDGSEIASHRGGYSRFRVQVPEKAIKNGRFDMTVLADNRLNEHVSPHFGDFTVFGGIPRPVNLLICEDSHFDYLYHGTDGLILRTEVDAEGNGILNVEPHTVHVQPAKLAVRVLDEQGKTAAFGEGSADEEMRLVIPQVNLWHGRKAPHLYTVKADLIAEGRVADTAALKTGFRSIRVDGNGFYLNGAHVFLHGVARHQDRAEVYTAVTPQMIAEDFDLIDEIGANAVRLSHYQHPQAAYDECDQRGILCWAEIPMLKMTEDAALQENAQQQLTELILQNIHHPSVYCWGIQNEIAMFRDAPFMHERCRELNGLAKALDPTRLTACANLYPVPPESKLNGITDIVGYNYYFGWYYGTFADYGKYLDAFHKARPQVPVGITEYGADANLALHSSDPKVKDYSEEYQALYHESVYPYLREREWLWGSSVWNMFDFSSDRRDEGGVKGINGKGLVSYDRTIRKDAFYYYKAQWSKTPFLHICGKRYDQRAAETISVKVYTNCPEAVLTVNEKHLGCRKKNGNGIILFENVPLAAGENQVTVTYGAYSDKAAFIRVEKEPESYHLPDSGGGNVVNWFLQGDLKDDCFSILDSAQTILDSPAASSVLKEMNPKLYAALTGNTGIPLGLTLKSILSRDTKDPEQILRINQALQEIQKTKSNDGRE
ncbi:MAG: glycoside hydrolase family 2 protein [Clostridia bacterium]|nr:glycoside hydrolase family 2 protein [Clostridia bacterium]